MNWEIIGVGAGVVGLMYTFFRNLKSDLNGRFEKIDGRFEKIESELKEIRTGLNRMEGAFYSKDCCMLKDSKLSEKVE